MFTNPNGGFWETGTNWSQGTPGPTDTAVISDTGGYYTIVVTNPMTVANLTINGASIQFKSSVNIGTRKSCQNLSDVISLPKRYNSQIPRKCYTLFLHTSRRCRNNIHWKFNCKCRGYF